MKYSAQQQENKYPKGRGGQKKSDNLVIPLELKMTTLSFHFICLLIPSLNMALFCRDFSKESNILRKKIIYYLLPFSCLGNTNFNSQKFLESVKLVSVVREDITKSDGTEPKQMLAEEQEMVCD